LFFIESHQAVVQLRLQANAISNPRTPSGLRTRPLTAIVTTAAPTTANPKARLTVPTSGSAKLSHGTVNTYAQSR